MLQRVDAFAFREERSRPSPRPDKSIPPWRKSAEPVERRNNGRVVWPERPEQNFDPPGDQFPL